MSRNMDEKVAKNNAKEAKKAAKLGKKNSRKQEKVIGNENKDAGHSAITTRIRKKLPGSRKNLPKLTNDTIDEYREKILAGGRKFKYPIQVSKHRILVISLSAVVIVAILFALWIYFMLYHSQSTSDFYYDVTRVLPAPVASVNGQSVSYSDYLRRVRADIYYYTTQEGKNLSDKAGQNELNYNKRKELDTSEEFAYAEQIASQRGVSVSDQDVTDIINNQLSTNNIDQAALSRTLKTYYNWSLDEYRSAIKSQLLIQKVSFAVDTEAKGKASNIKAQLSKGADFSKLASSDSDDQTSRNNGGEIDGKLSDDNPLFNIAKKMHEGQVSSPTEYTANDGTLAYAIVKLDSIDGNDIKIQFIQINLAQFSKDFAKLKSDNKISEYINVPSDKSFSN